MESDVVLELSPHRKLKPRACRLVVDPDSAYITCHTSLAPTASNAQRATRRMMI